MKPFKTLLNESYKGRFVVEPNELTEIHVDYERMQISILYFRTKKDLTPLKKELFTSLAGMFGTPTVEEKFNEIIKRKTFNK